uniref:Uncharacterized protein n=1 Tax=Siphoviridae sp. ctxdc10 TaxID=2825740 RepID=A0A8S5TSI7_9CAUD|nr:MAG TPA: hypothetical protein [Siphoviridae sp. ctxdc10]
MLLTFYIVTSVRRTFPLSSQCKTTVSRCDGQRFNS